MGKRFVNVPILENHTCRVILALTVTIVVGICRVGASSDEYTRFGTDKFRCYWLPQSGDRVWGPAIVWPYKSGSDDASTPAEYEPIALSVVADGRLAAIEVENSDLLRDCGPPGDVYPRRSSLFYPPGKEEGERNDIKQGVKAFLTRVSKSIAVSEIGTCRMRLIHKKIPANWKEFLDNDFWIMAWDPNDMTGTVRDSETPATECKLLADSWKSVNCKDNGLRKELAIHASAEVLATGDRAIVCVKSNTYHISLLNEWQGLPSKQLTHRDLMTSITKNEWVLIPGPEYPSIEDIARMLSSSCEQEWESTLRADPILWFLGP